MNLAHRYTIRPMLATHDGIREANGIEATASNLWRGNDMDKQQTIEARKIVEALRHYRRGLRQLEHGEPEKAKASAAAVAEIILDDLRRDILAGMFGLAASVTMETFERRAERYRKREQARMDKAMDIYHKIMEGGRKEEARRVERLAIEAPWYRRYGIIQKAQTLYAEFSGIVKAAVASYGMEDYREALEEIEGLLAATEGAA